MKVVECDICRDRIFDPCEWHWTMKRETLRGDKKKLHICGRCATALIDAVIEKRKQNEGVPVNGDDGC